MAKKLNSFGYPTIGRVQYFLDNYVGKEIRTQLYFRDGSVYLEEELFSKICWERREYTINSKKIIISIPIFTFADIHYAEVQEEEINNVTIHLEEFQLHFTQEELVEIEKRFSTGKEIINSSIR